MRAFECESGASEVQAAGAWFLSLSQLLPDDSNQGSGEGTSLATACAVAKAVQAGASGPYAPLEPTCRLFFRKVAPEAADVARELLGTLGITATAEHPAR